MRQTTRLLTRARVCKSRSYYGSVKSRSSNGFSYKSGVTVKNSNMFYKAPVAHFSTSSISQSNSGHQTLQQLSESFLDGESANYLDEMYSAWEKNPSSVHVSWDVYFRNLTAGVEPGQAYRAPPTLHTYENQPDSAQVPTRPANVVAGVQIKSGAANEEDIKNSMRVLLLIRSYQVNGHLLANLDPLGIKPRQQPVELDPTSYGFVEGDMDKKIFLGESTLISGFLRSLGTYVTLRDIITRLQQTYCGNIGIEYMHIHDREECNWIRERLETPKQYVFSGEDKKLILDRLYWSGLFEQFLAIKYVGAKRFGLEGCESLIPGLKSMIDEAGELGVEGMVFGMPHRGRLNVLANVVRKPLDQILHEFDPDGQRDQSDDLGYGTGDVKYHLGTSYDRPTRFGKNIHLSLLANPSHLECVNPVVLGKVRAKQHYLQDKERGRVAPVILHGDAAFCGQGVSYETFDMTLFKNYSVGGTIHIVVNNQIGFTTDTMNSRVSNASRYCTDIAKTAVAPIFHVNGDDPEAVVFVFKLAAEYRQQFKKDVVIDVFCYRKHGHNEGDEPRFTQPLMYSKITKHKSCLDTYEARLISENVLTKQESDGMRKKIMEHFNTYYNSRDSYKPKEGDWLSSVWKGLKKSGDISKIRYTGLPKSSLEYLTSVLTTIPDTFTPHKKMKDLFDKKKAALTAGKGIDWATAEALAFGSLITEGFTVRLSGQDVERGTFSQRHAVIHDVNTDQHYVPLSTLKGSHNNKIGSFEVCNSSLSEFGVLGFELGYSLENPNSLVMWEAQFGDFANGAQVIFDQFISSGEQKWLRQSGLTVLLPHGYDGQGPEHSSCRVERFLQMCDADPDVYPQMSENERNQIQKSNMQVVNCSTPANYFHVLRRQMHRDFRKPLIVVTPKRLLRHPRAVSNIADFSENTRFSRVIKETDEEISRHADKVRRLIFCTGNVYYDLIEAREGKGIKDVAIVRVEQLAPWPFDRVEEEGKRYKNAEVMWVQEEPKNMGAWMHAYHNLKTTLRASKEKGWEPRYVGRRASASPATGSMKAHRRQLAEFLEQAFAK
eukprot:TRINITY_DN770_c0_g1_i1.p1 TRINITY_DN770_c0_g1~~TRINITY_DN770_c0_g1_i1.p1  ORF type:complete len:1056 (-),score=245.70 TRINITY_DN770_c0_g1_i1:46-3213(-)